MNPTTPVTNNIETVERADWLRAVPVELSPTVPETVWMTLTLEAKKDLLRQNGLLEKYENPTQQSEQVNQQQETLKAEVADAPKAEVIVEQVQKVERSPEFAQAVEQLKEIDKKDDKVEENKPVLSKEDIQRIETEKAQSANIKTYKFFGYQPSTTTYASAKSISTTGPISDSKTWAATLISKIFSLFE